MTLWQWLAVQNWHKIMLALGAALTAEQIFVAPTVTGKIQAFLIAFVMYLVRPSQTSKNVEKISDSIPGNQPPAPPTLFPPS